MHQIVPPTQGVSIADMERATEIAAELVRRYGDSYWPFFERMERELASRKKRREKLTSFTRERSKR